MLLDKTQCSESLEQFIAFNKLSPTATQRDNLSRILGFSGLVPYWESKGMIWGYSADEEFLIKYQDAKGVHYLTIGTVFNDVQYNIVPLYQKDFLPGIHADDYGLEQVIFAFCNGKYV